VQRSLLLGEKASGEEVLHHRAGGPSEERRCRAVWPAAEGCDHAAVGTQDAQALAERRDRVGKRFQYPEGHDGVQAVVVEVQRGGISHLKARAGIAHAMTSLLEHQGGVVDANHGGGVGLVEDQLRASPGARSDIDYVRAMRDVMTDLAPDALQRRAAGRVLPQGRREPSYQSAAAL